MFSFKFDFCVHKVSHLDCFNFFFDNLAKLIVQPSNYCVKFIDVNDCLCVFVSDLENFSRVNEFFRFELVRDLDNGTYRIPELSCDDDIGYTI